MAVASWESQCHQSPKKFFLESIFILCQTISLKCRTVCQLGSEQYLCTDVDSPQLGTQCICWLMRAGCLQDKELVFSDTLHSDLHSPLFFLLFIPPYSCLSLSPSLSDGPSWAVQLRLVWNRRLTGGKLALLFLEQSHGGPSDHHPLSNEQVMEA